MWRSNQTRLLLLLLLWRLGRWKLQRLNASGGPAATPPKRTAEKDKEERGEQRAERSWRVKLEACLQRDKHSLGWRDDATPRGIVTRTRPEANQGGGLAAWCAAVCQSQGFNLLVFIGDSVRCWLPQTDGSKGGFLFFELFLSHYVNRFILFLHFVLPVLPSAFITLVPFQIAQSERSRVLVQNETN